MWLVAGLTAAVFGFTVFTLMALLPQPLRALDHLVMGAVAVLVSLAVAFLATAMPIRSRGHRR